MTTYDYNHRKTNFNLRQKIKQKGTYKSEPVPKQECCEEVVAIVPASQGKIAFIFWEVFLNINQKSNFNSLPSEVFPYFGVGSLW